MEYIVLLSLLLISHNIVCVCLLRTLTHIHAYVCRERGERARKSRGEERREEEREGGERRRRTPHSLPA